MQKNPTLSAQEIKQIIEKSAHLYPYGNNYVGYGIPNAQKALLLLDNQKIMIQKTVKAIAQFEVELNPDFPKEKLILFHKKDAFRIIKQEHQNIGKKSIFITPPKNTKRTTLIYGDRLTEIVWETQN